MCVVILFTWPKTSSCTIMSPIRRPSGSCMFDDPKALTSANWNDIHIWLQWLWIYVPLVFTFVLTMLVAHAFIPSLVATGHLPATANRLRVPLTGFAAVVLVAAVIMMVLVINSTLDVGNIYDRFLI